MLFSNKKSDRKVISSGLIPTTILFKDFNKSTKDLLTKNFTAYGSWQVESKYKGPKDALYINPQANSDGKMSVDVEYALSKQPVSVKLNLTPDFQDNAKLTLSYTNKGHKLESVLHKKQGNVVDYEITHEACDAVEHLSLHEKLTKQAFEVGLGVELFPKYFLGCGSVYRLKDGVCEWNVGGRWADKGFELALFTSRKQIHTANAIFPLSFNLGNKRMKIQVAGEAICSAPAKVLNYTVGLSATCPFFPLNTIKAKIDGKLNWTAAYILKTEDNWAVSVSVDKELHCGVLLSYS